MRHQKLVSVIIPALNEEKAIYNVILDLPDWVDEIIVVDNGSTDRTSEVASSSGARVIREPRKGYGQACLAGIGILQKKEIIVFLDGDYSDYPEDLANIVDPILMDNADMVIGSRTKVAQNRHALTVQQKFGNWLACILMRLIWRHRYSDLGPFRAIKYDKLMSLEMSDTNYGWTIEMQIKAILNRLNIQEVPVRYRKRIGQSKISGTLKGSILAGVKILSIIGLYAVKYGVKRQK